MLQNKVNILLTERLLVFPGRLKWHFIAFCNCYGHTLHLGRLCTKRDCLAKNLHVLPYRRSSIIQDSYSLCFL